MIRAPLGKTSNASWHGVRSAPQALQGRDGRDPQAPAGLGVGAERTALGPTRAVTSAFPSYASNASLLSRAKGGLGLTALRSALSLATSFGAHLAGCAVLCVALGIPGCGQEPTLGVGDTAAGDLDPHADGGDLDGLQFDVCKPACLPGYVCRPGDAANARPARCVVDPALACAPCALDAACLGGVCAAIGGEGPFCLIPCRLDDDHCPSGLRCAVRGGAPVCVPDGDSCTCLPTTQQKTRACDGGAAATCGASQICEAAGWSACTPTPVAPEVCNGKDDDCDGQTDEATAPAGVCQVQNALGSCPGAWACAVPDGAAGAPPALVCQGQAPGAEACNGVDDDCDSVTDEPWRKGSFTYGDAHCGVCGNSCVGAFPHGTGACDGTTSPPHCAVASCDQGYAIGPLGGCEPIVSGPCDACASDADCALGVPCVPAPTDSGVPGKGVCALPCAPGCPANHSCVSTAFGQRCLPGSDACSCTSLSVGKTRACFRNNAEGACKGVQACSDAGWSACGAKTPAADVCNGFDDDCDGKTDEAGGQGAACTTVNAAGSCPGKSVCLGGGGLTCDAQVPTVDLCNGLDDDCDGKTDPGALDPVSGLYLSAAHCGGCDLPCPSSFGPHAFAVCALQAAKPTCGMGCEAGFVDLDLQAWSGCECQKLSEDDLAGGGDANCDGVDGNAALAIFVAVHGSDDWPGSRAQPMRSVGAAVERAAATAKRDVYVQAGSFAGSFTLRPKVHVYGGYGPGWAARNPSAWTSTLLAGPGPLMEASGDAITVRCVGAPDGASFSARLDGFRVEGGVASQPGRSSYAVVSDGCGPGVAFIGLSLVLGKGADGSAGSKGADGGGGVSAQGGKIAYDIGTSTCKQQHWNAGGASGSRTCVGPGGLADVSGGQGGTAICPDFHDDIDPPQCALLDEVVWKQTPAAIEPGAPGKAAAKGGGAGVGGASGADSMIEPQTGNITACKSPMMGCIKCETANKKTTGTSGTPGQDGTLGGSGAGGGATAKLVTTASPGELPSLRYGGSAGTGGGDGSHGGGGGGGGAAGGVQVVACFAQAGHHDIGGSGGGGGSGGCAGGGGQAGGPGGGAFGLWLVPTGSSDKPLWPLLQGIAIHGGQGGQGGAGGAGGKGGYGGFGGKGGPSKASESNSFCTSKGGNGGGGGNGGHGGGGGGGPGGPVIGVVGVGVNAAALQQASAGVQVATPGVGGAGGAGGSSAGAAGSKGAAGAALGSGVLAK